MITQLNLFTVEVESAPHTPCCACGAELMADLEWFIWGEFGDWQCRICYAERRRTFVSRRRRKDHAR